MSHLPYPRPKSIAQGKKEDEMVGAFTRRTVLAGAAAATAAMSVGAVDSPASAQTRLAPGFRAVPSLTDIDLEKSEPGSDPVDIKQEYFNWVNKKRQATLRRLLQITKDSPKSSDRSQAIIDKVQATPDTKYLARSIVLMWYLGAWYDPDNLRALAELPNPPAKASSFEVISPKAYTQGWALRVAQAHPMGFSEMQFGYWARPPSPRTDFIGN